MDAQEGKKGENAAQTWGIVKAEVGPDNEPYAMEELEEVHYNQRICGKQSKKRRR